MFSGYRTVKRVFIQGIYYLLTKVREIDKEDFSATLF